MVAANFDDAANALTPGFAAQHARDDRRRAAAPDVEVVALVGFSIDDGETSRVIQAGERLAMNEHDVDGVHAGRVRRVDPSAAP